MDGCVWMDQWVNGWVFGCMGWMDEQMEDWLSYKKEGILNPYVDF